MEAKAHLKRIESAPWADDELAVRDGMLAVLRTDEPPPAAAAAAASGAADDPTSLIGGLDATMMLQTIRGYYYEEPRTENTLAAYHRILSWRAEQGADTVLSDPPAEVVAEHAAWREIWFMDIYGMNSSGHPIIGHQVGSIPTVEFAARYSLETICQQYMRDMEFVDWYKRQLSAAAAAQARTKGVASPEDVDSTRIYKAVVLVDMDGMGRGHISGDFKLKAKETITMLQAYYPEAVFKIYVVNSPFLFRAGWSMVKPWLHPNTQANINILGYNTAANLKIFAEAGVPTSALPKWAGGEMEAGAGLLGKYMREGSPPLETNFRFLRDILPGGQGGGDDGGGGGSHAGTGEKPPPLMAQGEPLQEGAGAAVSTAPVAMEPPVTTQQGPKPPSMAVPRSDGGGLDGDDDAAAVDGRSSSAVAARPPSIRLSPDVTRQSSSRRHAAPQWPATARGSGGEWSPEELREQLDAVSQLLHDMVRYRWLLLPRGCAAALPLGPGAGGWPD
jgi:hypothetical protein